jgi:flavodoxin
MKCAVRYCSRSGNTRFLAETIAEELGVPAVSVDAPEAKLSGHTDVLFIGGAPLCLWPRQEACLLYQDA